MTRLEKILAPYEQLGALGGNSNEFDREHLRKALEQASAHTNVVFWIAAAMHAAAVIVMIWLVTINANDPKVIGYVLGGGGGALAGICFAMMRLWQEKAATDLTCALVGSLNEDAARSTLNIIASRLRRSRSAASRPRKVAAPRRG